MPHNKEDSYWVIIWKQFYKHSLGRIALFVVIAFCLIGIYAPFLAASKPIVVQYDGEWYFPLFRYLFYPGYYTKLLDIFFNLLIFTVPLVLLCFYFLRGKLLVLSLSILAILQISLFMFFVYGLFKDPAFDRQLNMQRDTALQSHPLPSWDFDLKYMSPYAKLNLLIHSKILQQQQRRLQKYSSLYAESVKISLFKGLPTLWQIRRDNEDSEIQRQSEIMRTAPKDSETYQKAKAAVDYILDKRKWIDSQIPLLRYDVMPLLRPFHWEDDAGGNQTLNKLIPFWELSRVNGKDLMAALIFGVRISLVVGILAVSLALAIGLPVGAYAGYYGGTIDIIVSRLLEIWEGMPTFFMLLMVVAILQSKSIFLVITIIGLFGWTSFSRYTRGEFFKQRNLPYTEACRAIGLHDARIMFSHILPNAIPPVLTLLPFAIMGAISSEAGLSFLGLGEEGSCSWGVLMDEGRTAFPSQSYLLWPPAILLTTLLIAIALVGDSLRDALDPKMHRI